VDRLRSSLVLGDRIVSRSDDGLLAVEYVLFEPDEVIVNSRAYVGAREEGYLTTAAYARERLRAAGISPELARQAWAALPPHSVLALARAPFVVPLLARLQPEEAFEGGTYAARTQDYAGTWLDLRGLAAAVPLDRVAPLLQALHLSALLEEVDDDVPVRLLTAEITHAGQPGTRTWRKVSFVGAERLPGLLRAVRTLRGPDPRDRDAADEAAWHEVLLTTLRARANASARARERLLDLTRALGGARGELRSGQNMLVTQKITDDTLEDPRESVTPDTIDVTSSDMSSSPPRNTPIPQTLDLGMADPSLGAAVANDRVRLFEMLRNHTELLRGEGHLRDVAQFLSAMGERSAQVPDLVLLAARAWSAAGEIGHARYLAKKLLAAESVPDHVLLVAQEILASTRETKESGIPPPLESLEPAPAERAGLGDGPAPPGASRPPYESSPHAYAALVVPSAPRVPAEAAAVAPAPKFRHGRPEIVETLSLPAGITEDMLPEGAPARGAKQVRLAMIRQARTLGRDYRIWYGTTLVTSAVAIETMQRHLRRRFDEARDAQQVRSLEAELTRHGALLSEILARTLGAEWADVSHAQPGHWTMSLPWGLVVWPIGRVYRFFRRGQREEDLVAFYLDLDTQARKSGHLA
jgi:hypothetical protein